MSDFRLTEDQEKIQQKIRDRVQRTILPAALPADRRSAPGPPPAAFLELIGEERLGAMFIPRASGGLGYDYATGAVVLEELAAGCPGLAAMAAASLHAGAPVLMVGTAEQKQLFLPWLTEASPGLGGFAVTERQAGSDVAAISTLARRGSGGYLLTGIKCSVINAGIAGFYLVFASLAPGKGRAGLNAFIVPANAAGLTVGPLEDKVGLRNAPTAEVALQEVFVPASHLIGREGAGYLLLMQTLDRGRAFSAAVAVGTARAAFELALAYARERRQFGRAIIKNQAVSFALAEMATTIQAARLLTWHACRLIDADEDYSQAAAMAKYFSSRAAEEVTAWAMDLFGRYAHNKTYPIEKLWRDAKTIATVEGTHNVQRMVIASLL
ncbi:MAG: acyl-CoA dehydrogenase family protein [Bacillota bacterium]